MEEIDLEFYKNAAQKNTRENQKFLGILKKKPPKNIDYLAEETHEEVFKEIDCMTCANCCRTTGPMYTEKDIDRISKHLRMKARDFEDKFLRVDEDEDKVLKNLPCTFLADDNACMIYDVRPKACREYPHTDRKKVQQINTIMLKNTLICPAAFVWVEKMKVKLT